MTAAALAALAACVFVSFYNWASALAFERGVPLPAVTRYVVELAPYAYSLPVVVFSLGVLLLRSGRDRPVVFESLISFGWLASFVWVLVALWVWQLTRIDIMNHVR
jgi:hypothetical protein